MPSYLDWSKDTISFGREDHPDYVPHPGRYPLVVDPIIGNTHFSKVLMDGGSSLNIMEFNPLARSTYPSASARQPTSSRKCSPSRWWDFGEPTMPY